MAGSDSSEKVYETTVDATPVEIVAAAEEFMCFKGCKVLDKSKSKIVFDKDVISKRHFAWGGIFGAEAMRRRKEIFLTTEASLGKTKIMTNSKSLLNHFKD